ADPLLDAKDDSIITLAVPDQQHEIGGPEPQLNAWPESLADQNGDRSIARLPNDLEVERGVRGGAGVPDLKWESRSMQRTHPVPIPPGGLEARIAIGSNIHNHHVRRPCLIDRFIAAT
ncbi:hypothetical protein HK102_012226, partial [Quaeritorhiza haematococci]